MEFPSLQSFHENTLPTEFVHHSVDSAKDDGIVPFVYRVVTSASAACAVAIKPAKSNLVIFIARSFSW